MAEQKTYRIERIADLLQVPSDRRKQCAKELLIVLEMSELAGVEDAMGAIEWTDDGDMSCAMADADGVNFLKLEVKRD